MHTNKPSAPTYGGAWRPSPQQELLLRAALWQGDAARAAWKTWYAQTQLAPIDQGSYRLLPLVYLNLLAAGNAHPARAELKKIYHHTWYHSQIRLRRGAAVLRALHQQHIPTLLLKACALIPLYYHDAGARPFSDLDILVPSSHLRLALEILNREGWTPESRPLAEMNEHYVARWYAHTLANAQGAQLDLHHRSLYLETRAEGDAEFWAGSIPLDFFGVPTQALNPADQLLHICAHALAWNRISPMRWVADAFVVLRAEKVDWARFLQTTRDHDLGLAMSHLLSYLRDEFHAPIPQAVLDALAQLQSSSFRKLEYRLMALPPAERSATSKLIYHVECYRQLARVYKNKNWLLRFPAFLRDTWDLASLREVPKYILHYTTTRVAARFKASPRRLNEDS